MIDVFEYRFVNLAAIARDLPNADMDMFDACKTAALRFLKPYTALWGTAAIYVTDDCEIEVRWRTNLPGRPVVNVLFRELDCEFYVHNPETEQVDPFHEFVPHDDLFGLLDGWHETAKRGAR